MDTMTSLYYDLCRCDCDKWNEIGVCNYLELASASAWKKLSLLPSQVLFIIQ
jgi:hypothetical protein